MTKDDIIRMAREAGFVVDGDSWIHAGAVLVDGRKSINKPLKAFAALVAAAEREACAKLCEDASTPPVGEMLTDGQWAAKVLAGKIKARGNT